jgi:hypothetical protein
MKAPTHPRTSAPVPLRTLAAALLLPALAAPAAAFDIPTGQGDLTLRWDNTFRYNLGARMQNAKPEIALAGPGPAYTYDESDYLFADRGDVITNRIDLLSELDLRFRDRFGARLSAAGWYDHAYHGKHPVTAPAQALPPGAAQPSAGGTSYGDGRFSSYTKRFYAGPSGEILDAYVYGGFDIAEMPLNLRLGRHVVIWGEGLFGSSHSIAYAQTPSDARKATSNPGASAKETALPIGQLSATFQPTPEVTVLAQYLYEWRPSRIPEGGTFFAGADSIEYGPTSHRRSPMEGDRGDTGLGLRWSPEWLDGTVGVYFRRFDDKGSWAAQPAGDPADVFATRSVYAKNIRLVGLSLSKNVLGLSVGADLSHRSNAPLNSVPTASAGPAGRYEGAIGDTWHAVVNAVKTFGPTPLFDSAALSGELAYSRLDKVTKNQNLFKASGYNAFCGPTFADNQPAKIRGCADKEFFSLALSFSPSWTQVLPSVDVSLPIFVSRNLHGNAPGNGGGSEGFTTYKIGISAVASARHLFDLAYTGYDQKVGPRSTAGTPAGYGRILGAPYQDKGWLSFTYQTSF